MKKLKFLAIRIDEVLHQRIKMLALIKKISIQELIEKLLIESLDES
jgi:predicted HicB family RNase H-like nuclease